MHGLRLYTNGYHPMIHASVITIFAVRSEFTFHRYPDEAGGLEEVSK
jgi:hypothetical protein